MTIKIVPETRTLICDCCERTTEHVTWKKSAVLTLKRSALDYLGDPCADATIKLDLCDDCESQVVAAINSVKEKINA